MSLGRDSHQGTRFLHCSMPLTARTTGELWENLWNESDVVRVFLRRQGFPHTRVQLYPLGMDNEDWYAGMCVPCNATEIT